MEVEMISCPVEESKAREIEKFFLEIFGYCNYDLGRAFSGGYGKDVKFEFCAIWQENFLIAAGVLLKSSDEMFAIIGPFGVRGDVQGKGFGSFLLNYILEKLKYDEVRSVYLGIKQKSRAAEFYKRMGFESIGGVVMKKSFEKGFEKDYFKVSGDISVRDAEWSDWAGAQVAMAESGELGKFAGLFYDMKTEAEKDGKVLKVLCAMKKIVGVDTLKGSKFPRREL